MILISWLLPLAARAPCSGPVRPNKVTDGPFVFQTKTGPWMQEPAPITPPNYCHGMLFHTFGGKTLMALHSHRDEHGHYIRIPRLFAADLAGDKLVLGPPFQP